MEPNDEEDSSCGFVGKLLFDVVNEETTPTTSVVARLIARDPAAVTRGYYGHASHFACYFGDKDYNDYDGGYNVTPVHNAATYGHSEALRMLLEAGGNPNDYLECDNGGVYAIERAVLGGHFDCVKLLAEAKTDLKNHYGIDGGNLAQSALTNDHPNVLRYLTSLGVGPINREEGLKIWLRHKNYQNSSRGSKKTIWSAALEDACQENISMIRLNKRPIALVACMLKELGIYHHLDASSFIDLREYLGRPGVAYDISNYPASDNKYNSYYDEHDL